MEKVPYDIAVLHRIDMQEAQIRRLTVGLRQCVRVVRQWHGEEVFETYYRHAPEMRLVREALPFEAAGIDDYDG